MDETFEAKMDAGLFSAGFFYGLGYFLVLDGIVNASFWNPALAFLLLLLGGFFVAGLNSSVLEGAIR